MTEIEAQIDILVKALLRYEDGHSMIDLRHVGEELFWHCDCCEESWSQGAEVTHATDCILGEAEQVMKERGAYD